MNEPPVPGSSGPSSPNLSRFYWLPLAVIVTAGLAVRLTFFAGLVHLDEMEYLRAAKDLAQGRVWSGAPAVIVQRMTTYAPVALSYRLFGVSHASSVLWPLLCSLLHVVLIARVVTLLAGSTAGLIAATLWSLLPIDVALATTVLPDGPMALFSTAAVYGFLKARRASGRSTGWYVLSSVFLVIAILAKQTALVTGGFLLLLGVRSARAGRSARVGAAVAAVATAAMFYYYYKFSGVWNWGFYSPWIDARTLTLTMTDWFAAISRAPEFGFLIPIAIVALALQVAERRRGDLFLALWLGFGFLSLEFATRTPFRYVPFVPEEFAARYSLFVFVPLVALVSSYLARRLQTREAAWVCSGIAVGVAGLAWIGTRGAPTLPPGVIRWEQWQLPFAAISSVAAAGAIFAGIASPSYVVGNPARWKTYTACGLLATLAMASLSPAYNLSTRYRMPFVQNVEIAMPFMRPRPPLPWLAQNDSLAEWLDFAAGFSTGYDPYSPGPGRRLRVVPASSAEVGSAYVFVDQTSFTAPSRITDPGPPYLKSPPSNWWRIGVLGEEASYHLLVYRVLTPDDARRELIEARAAYAIQPSPEAIERLTGAQINAGDYCGPARRAWTASHGQAPAESDALLRMISDCYGTNPEIGGANLLVNGDFVHGLDGWARPTNPDVDVEVSKDPAGGSQSHITARSAEQKAVVLQSALLEPNSVYAFEATLKSTGVVVALYSSVDGGRFDAERAIPELQKRRVVFVTPPWDGKPRRADFIPFLLKAPGQVWLKDVKLVKLKLD